MAEMLVDGAKLDACNTAEADAIRAKTGGSSAIPYDYANNKGFADAIASIPSGTTIADGIVFTAFDANGNPTAADIYGNLPNFAFGYYGNPNSYGKYITSVSFKGGTKVIKYGAFQKIAVTSLSIPDSVDTIEAQAYRGNIAIEHFVHENARNLYGYNGGAVLSLYYMGSNDVFKTLQLGAVGKPVTSLYYQAFNLQAPSTAVYTIYCMGEKVDDFLASMRRQYVTTQTIIFKAAEDTTYNGQSYAAGDTILTSEVSA